MKKHLHKTPPLIAFLFLALLLNDRLLANINPPTPTCPIVTERFQGLGDGATVNNSSTGWYLNASQVAGSGYFAVKSNRFHAQELGGEGIWYSKVFSVSGYSDFQVAVKVSSEGDMNSSEYVRIYYKVNGGSETLLESRTGNFGTIDFISPTLTGNNVQLVVKLYNYNNGGSQTSKYYIEEYRVFKEHGPCASSIPVSITASGNGVLTCANPSLTLSAGTTVTGTTTWSWTGPGGFTSTSQNPSVTVAGTYTVVGTNASGSGSSTITVTENKVAPVVTATGGALACGTSVIISATSSVTSTYSWTGPGGFTSTLQNPSVSVAGTYTVTVTNPSNGCTTSKTATVTAGSVTTSTIWLQEFTRPNGSTSGNAPNAWTSSTPSGNFSVQNNVFYVNSIGTGSSEGVWTSESFSITGNSNVGISVSVRSAATSGGALESSGSSLDYMRMYYKLNGGAEVLFQEYLGTINSNSTTFSIASVGSLSGSTLQIIIRGRTTTSDEHYYFDNVTVTGTEGAPQITPSVTGTITCTSTAQLSVTATGGVVSSYAWTGPNGFTSAIQNPVVSAGGQYIVTATLSGGCTVSAPITITENKTLPDISASGGALVCNTSITLNANSAVSGATYSWTGPNSYSSTSKNPVVTATGSYTVTVTNPANGCTASQTVSVTSGLTAPTSFWLEDFTLPDGTTVDNATATTWSASTSGSGTYAVTGNEFKTSFSSDAEGVWTSQSINISGKTSINLSIYLKSEATTNNALETSDYIRIYYKLNGGAETLLYEELAGIGSSTTGTASATPNLSLPDGNTIQLVIRTRNSGVSEKYYFDNINITGSPSLAENVTASSAGVLSCTVTTVNLSGTSTTSGLSYAWTGPNGFTSSVQNPSVTAAGIYTLTVTNPATGCTGTDTALVIANTTQPVVSASASGSLNCTISSVAVSAASATQGLSYSWTGPGGFTSAQQSAVVSVAGTYTVTAINPANGCTGTNSVTVLTENTSTGTLWLEDFALSNGTAVDNGNTAWSVSVNPATTLFSVHDNQFRVSNSDITGEGVWTSAPVTITGKTNVTISAGVRSAITGEAVMNTSGDYMDYIRFYYKLNGGTEVLFAERLGAINNHSTTPSGISIASLSGNTIQIVVRARATGVDEFYYFDNMTIVATGQSNVNALASGGGTITCITTSVGLTGSSTSSAPVYSWTGPNGYTSTTQNPSVSVAGDYILTVTSGGCTAKDTVTVFQNTAIPANVNITSSTGSNEFNCYVGAFTMTASSSTTGITYSWLLPNGVSFEGSASGTIGVGDYIVTATHPVSGCTVKDTFTAVNNYAMASDGQITLSPAALTCTNSSVTLTGSNSLAGVTYTWVTGTGAFLGSGPTLTVTQPGFYNLVMKHPVSGCNHTIAKAVDVVSDPPLNVTITTLSANTQINCISGSVTLRGNSTTAGTTYAWTGPGGYTSSGSDAVITTSGEYTMTVTNTASGCTASVSTTVISNTIQPTDVLATAITNGGQLTCTHTSINLSGSSSTTGVNYSWSGPSGFTASGNNVAVIDSGRYVLTVTDPANGCTASSDVTITANRTQPAGVSATHADILTCLTTSTDLTGNSSTPGASYLWTGPDGFTAATRNTVASAAGAYFLKVTNPVNGCSRTVSTVVEQDTTPPAGVTASNNGPLTCQIFEVTLTGGTSAMDVDYAWKDPDGNFISFAPTVVVSNSGTYTFIVTDLASNGCSASVTTTVEFNQVGCSDKMATPPAKPVVLADSEQPAREFTHKVYPNPTTDHAFIEFRSVGNDHVTVKIVNSNASGEKMIFNNRVIAGHTYKLVWNAGDLPAGMYYSIITVNGKAYSNKLILIR